MSLTAEEIEEEITLFYGLIEKIESLGRKPIPPLLMTGHILFAKAERGRVLLKHEVDKIVQETFDRLNARPQKTVAPES